MKVSFVKKCTIIILLCSVIFTACNSDINNVNPVAFKNIQQQELNLYLTNYRKIYRLPAIAVVVIRDSAIYYYTNGKSNIKDDIDFTDSTLFFTGSLSELMVATGALKLAELAKLIKMLA